MLTNCLGMETDVSLECKLREMTSIVDTTSGAYALHGCVSTCGVEGIDDLCFDMVSLIAPDTSSP